MRRGALVSHAFCLSRRFSAPLYFTLGHNSLFFIVEFVGPPFFSVPLRRDLLCLFFHSIFQGLGVFTTEVIRAHELVAEYAGERVKLEEAKKRAATCRQIKVTVSYRIGSCGRFFVQH